MTKNTSIKADFSVSTERFFNDYGEEVFKGGQFVTAGVYIEVDCGFQVELEQDGILPALHNGRRSMYRRIERPWVTMSHICTPTEARP